MKIAVVSFSFTGHVENIVNILKKQIHSFDLTFFPIHNIDYSSNLFVFDYVKLSLMALNNKCSQIKPLSFNSCDFDHIIFITPVWAGRLPPAMNTFFRDYEINCNYSVIISCFIEFDSILNNIQTKKLRGTGCLVEKAIIYDRKPELIDITLKKFEQSLIQQLKVYTKEVIHDDSLFF